MAIKSRGRARGGRSVAAAPRRPLVVRKPPIWRRPWLWIVVGLLALGGILTGVVLTMQNNDRAGGRDRERRAVQTLFNEIRGALPSDILPVPPDVLVIFSTVQDDLDAFGTEITGDELRARGEEIAADAEESYTALQNVAVEELIPEEFAEDRQTLIDARLLMSQAVGMYQRIGALITSTAGMSEDERTAVLDQVRLLTNDAGTLFDQGYRKLTSVAERLGISVETPFNPPAPLPSVTPSVSPSATASPGPSPSGSASPEPSASPSASANPTPSPSASP